MTTPRNSVNTIVPEFNPELTATVSIEEGYEAVIRQNKDQIENLGGLISNSSKEDGRIEISFGEGLNNAPCGKREVHAFLHALLSILPSIAIEEMEVTFTTSTPHSEAVIERLEASRRAYGAPRVSDKNEKYIEFTKFFNYNEPVEIERSLAKGLKSKFVWYLDDNNNQKISIIGKCFWRKDGNTEPPNETHLQRMVNHTVGLAKQSDKAIGGQQPGATTPQF